MNGIDGQSHEARVGCKGWHCPAATLHEGANEFSLPGSRDIGKVRLMLVRRIVAVEVHIGSAFLHDGVRIWIGWFDRHPRR